MKKTLLAASLLSVGFAANAQLANGSTAPDFTATDLNGVSHSLYADYLNQGKTVIIDISATWCGPCWNYHGTRALADFQEAFGPDGSNDAVVLFIEGDPTTSVESLYGTNTTSDNSVTRGNWTNHSPYPIIDDTTGSISTAYNIAFFPTVYMICPSGVVKVLNQPSAATIKTQVNANCGTLTGVNDKARPDVSAVIFCEADGTYSARVKNLGANKVTSATLVLKENGSVLATQTYSNTTGINQFASATVNFGALTFTADADHTVELTELNGFTTLPYPDLAVEEASIISNNASEVANNLRVDIHTDFYPKEASWEIRKNDSGEQLVASGGNYVAGTVGQYNGGGPDANTIKSHYVSLPEGIECYKVILKDTFGDGWIYGATGAVDTSEFHGIKIYNDEEMVYEQSVSTFTFSTQTYVSALVSNGVLATDAPAVTKGFTLYPNPTSGVLNIRTTEEVSILITDLTGKTVFTAKGLNDGSSVNLSALQKGVYVATVNGASGQKSEKVIIN